jgi:5-methylcytosine-specific restriction endonuclease McrA
MTDNDCTIPLKRCTKCGEEKPATAEFFKRSKKHKNGLRSECKKCSKAYESARVSGEIKVNPRISTRDGMRKCSVCLEWKPATADQFELNSANALGIGYKCRNCANEYKKKWAREHPESRSQSRRKWTEKNPLYFSTHYYSNWKSERLRRNIYYAKNKEKFVEKRKEYYRRNPEYYYIARHKRRALKKKSTGSFTQSDIRLLFALQKRKCWYCQKSIEDGYHMDHRIPLSRGGSNDISNIVLTCPHCNLSKNNKLPHEWGDRLL